MPHDAQSAWKVRSAALGAAAALAISLSAAPAASASDQNAVLSPLAFEVLAPPHPVVQADGREHLAYELEIANRSSREVTLAAVQATSHGEPVGSRMEGDALSAMLRRDSLEPGATLEPGEGAMLFLDVSYPRGSEVPRRLKHRIELVIENPPGPEPAQELSFAGVATKVARAAPVKLAPPLRGERWLAASGCCSAITPHRGATLSINGTTHVPERFAIDFVQLNAENRLFSGPIDQLTSYPFYGAPVRSAAAGEVVAVEDDLPDTTPGALPPDATVQTAGGNHVVVKLAPHRFAFYAHLVPGSVRVKPGERVRRGEVVGLLGNSGNSDAPHLHFHVMDSPSPLQSNGLPYVFRRFAGQGMVGDIEPIEAGEPAQIDAGAFAGGHRRVLSLNGQLVRFPSG